MRSDQKIGDKGQAGVEYVLLVSVIVIIIASLAPKIRGFLLAEDGCSEGSKKPMCQIMNPLNPENLKYFRVQK